VAIPLKDVMGVLGTTGLRATAVATDAVVTLPADPNRGWKIGTIIHSYSDELVAAGRLTITTAGTIIFDIDIMAHGPLTEYLMQPLMTGKGEQVKITLTAQAGMTGKLNVIAWQS
jgi:hypothetical protein